LQQVGKVNTERKEPQKIKILDRIDEAVKRSGAEKSLFLIINKENYREERERWTYSGRGESDEAL
jgi:hypothetical protein